MINQSELFPGLCVKKQAHKYFPVNVLTYEDRRIIADKLIAKSNVLQRSMSLRTIRSGQRLESEANRFAACGKESILWRCENDHVFFTKQSCKSRGCEACSMAAFLKISGGLRDIISPCLDQKKKGYYLSLLTLTVNTARFGSGMPTHADLRRFNKETATFFRLWYGKWAAKTTASGKVIDDKSRFFPKSTKGGKRKSRPSRPMVNRAGNQVQDYRRFRGAGYISAIEVAPDNNNLHCHAIVYGPYILQKKLAASWKKITGDSYIVDIKRIYKKSTAIAYVMKYVVKPPNTDSYSALADWILMIKGTRRLRAGGIFFDRLRKQLADRPPLVCPKCGLTLCNIGHFDLSADVLTGLNNLYQALRARAGPGS